MLGESFAVERKPFYLKIVSSSKNVENFSSICMRFQYTHRLGQDQALYWSLVSKLFVISFRIALV